MDLFAQLGEAVGDHWPFVAAMLIFATIGQVLKGTVWTERNFLRWRTETPNAVLWRFFWWGRKTMPLHPVAVGALVGVLWSLPVADKVDTRAAAVLYFAFAGIMSTWAFAIAKGWAKKKGIDLKLPGTSKPPPDSKE